MAKLLNFINKPFTRLKSRICELGLSIKAILIKLLNNLCNNTRCVWRILKNCSTKFWGAVKTWCQTIALRTKFIVKRHWNLTDAFLLVGFVFCICILLFHVKVISYPIFGYAKEAELINETIYDLACSYLAGLLFYVLITYLPQKKQAKESLSLLHDSISSLMFDLARLVADVDYLNGKMVYHRKSGQKQELEETIFYVRVHKVADDGEITDNSTIENVSIKMVLALSKNVKDRINTILTSSVGHNLNYKIISLLTQISKDDCHRSIKMQVEQLQSNIILSVFEKKGCLTELHNNLIEALEIELPVRYCLKDLSDEEKLEYKQFLSENEDLRNRFKNITTVKQIYKGNRRIK